MKNKSDNMKEMKKLFDELWWLSDEKEAMEDFIKEIKEFTDYMGGNIYITLIDLYDLKYYEHGHIYIAFDDENNLNMMKSSEFIKYYKDQMCYDEEQHFEEYWTPKLKKIIKKYNT